MTDRRCGQEKDGQQRSSNYATVKGVFAAHQRRRPPDPFCRSSLGHTITHRLIPHGALVPQCFRTRDAEEHKGREGT